MPSYKDTIIRNKTDIIAVLCGDYRLILNKVHEHNLITLREYNNLKDINKETVEGHVVELVDKILNKNDEDICRRFLNLLQTDQDIKGAFPKLEKLPLGGNRPLSLPVPVPVPVPVQVSSSHGDTRPPENKTKKEEFYELKSQPLGLCVIINNENFEDGSVRGGSNQDADSLAKVFSWLGFSVVMCKDQTKSGMEEALKSFASLDDPSQQQLRWGFSVEKWFGDSFTPLSDPQQELRHGDVFVCCVLSHGVENAVSGIDLQTLTIKTIFTTFKLTKQSALKGKPKLFLIQTCQRKQERQELKQQGLDKDLELEADDFGPKSLPERADLLVVHATIDDEAENAHMTSGSRFVQSLSRRLQEGCPKGEKITKILERVNKDVDNSDGAVKETSEYTSTLRKELVLATQ